MKISLNRKVKNIIFKIILALSSLIVIIPLLLIFNFLLHKGFSSLNLDFFINTPKPVGEIGGGMKHAFVGTIIMVSIASLFAIPISIICAIYLSEYKKGKTATFLRFTIDMLSGIPSIIVGIFSYLIFVVTTKSFSALAGSFALFVIMLPIITRTSEEIFKLIPNHIREAGLALGLPKWRVIFNILIPSSKNSLMTGIILAISRAAGETAPLLFTAFGSMYLNYKITAPMASLPVQIYNYAVSPYDDWQRQAWAGAFSLIFMVLGLNLSARLYFKKNQFKKFFNKKS